MAEQELHEVRAEEAIRAITGQAKGKESGISRPIYNREKYLAEEFKRGGQAPIGGLSRGSQ